MFPTVAWMSSYKTPMWLEIQNAVKAWKTEISWLGFLPNDYIIGRFRWRLGQFFDTMMNITFHL